MINCMFKIHRLLTALNPFKNCVLCQQSKNPAQSICDFCQAQLPWLVHSCECCGAATATHSQTCGQCIQNPPLRRRTVCAFNYAFPVKQMITGFKFDAQFFYLPPLLHALHNTVLAKYQHDNLPTALLAVPLHRHRQQHRGFNQAQIIAQYLKKKLHIPLLLNTAYRTKNTPAQAQLSKTERHRNLQQAFLIKRPERIQQQHIAIIDDVITTGSTVESLAEGLLLNGATRVDVWGVAKA